MSMNNVGANPDFGMPGDSLNAIALLTFGFYNYESLFNQGIGFGFTPWMATMLFWLLVFLTIMFAQNIVLAIVVKAYKQSKAEVSEEGFSFPRLVARRLLYSTLWASGHKSTKRPYEKLGQVEGDDAKAVYRHAVMFARRDDDGTSDYERGRIIYTDKRRRFIVQFDGPEEHKYPEPYREVVRAGSLRAVRSDDSKGNIRVGAEVLAKYEGVWTEKVYLQYAIHQRSEVQGFFHYFHDNTSFSGEITNWLWDSGLAVQRAHKEMQPLFKPGGPTWDWTNPSSLLDYPMSYDELRILVKAVFSSYDESIDASEIHALLSLCEDTDALARDLFVSFSTPAEVEPPLPPSEEHRLEFLLREQALMKKQIQSLLKGVETWA